MSRVCIFGIGSPSGDDQAGWLTIDALLSSDMSVDAQVVVEKLDRPGATLIPRLEDAAWVILIDAMQSGSEPGSVHQFDREDWPGYGHGLSSHGFGVLGALSLADALGSLPARLELYGIEIGSAHPGAEPGEAVQAAAQALAGQIAAKLNRMPSGGIAPSDGTSNHSTKPASGQVAGYPQLSPASERGGKRDAQTD